jgi:hypothetical protein
MSKLRIIDIVKRSFQLLKKDPTLIVLFILPTLFPIETIITNFLFYYLVLSIAHNPLEPPSTLSIPPIPFVALYLIVGFFLGVWALAAAILKVTELEKGNRLGLKEALSKGLKKVPKLLVPAIASLSLFILSIASLTIAMIPYVLVGMSPPAQGVEPSIIVVRVAISFLFIIGLYVSIRLRLSAPACIIENNFGLRTSWKLVKGNWWKILAIFLLIFGAMSVIINRIPVIGRFVSDLIVSPPSIAATTLIYFQLREAKPPGEEHRESP